MPKSKRTSTSRGRARAVAAGPLNVVVDLSHHYAEPDFASARDSGGIIGVIHKATQGLTYTDPAYAGRRVSALAATLLWGAYHFGSDGVQQAERFQNVVQPTANTLLVLDFEANPQGPSMALEEARAVVPLTWATWTMWQ